MKVLRQRFGNGHAERDSERWHRSMRRRILAIGIIPILLLSLVAALGLRGSATATERELAATRQSLADDIVEAQLQRAATDLGRALDQALVERVDDVAAWASHPSVGDPAHLASELQRQEHFADLVMQIEPVDERWWSWAMASGAAVGSVTTHGPDGTTVIPIAARTTDPAVAEVGVVVGYLPIDSLHEIVDRAAADGDRDLTVLTADGAVIAESASDHDPANVGIGSSSPDQLSDGARAALSDSRGFISESGRSYGFASIDWSATSARVGATDPIDAIGGQGWMVVADEAGSAPIAPLDALDLLDRELSDARGQLALATVLAAVGAVVGCAVAAHLVARRLVVPTVSPTPRPEAVPAQAVEAEAVEAGGDDVELARQSDLRRTTADMFVNLGRRNQSLVKRQLRFIEQLEQSEEDPDRLAALFKLDHLATRMRRNAESLLVIAGHDNAVRRSNPVRIELVAQAALGEVEYFQRVNVTHIEPAAIVGRAVAGLAHVLAELIENALSFSPPDAPVDVVGKRGSSHYTVSVIDRGIGLSTAQLAAANEQLELGGESDLTSSKQLGLLVVAKLANRYGLRVELLESAAGGVTATVEVPNALVEPPKRRDPRPKRDAEAARPAATPPPAARKPATTTPPPTGSLSPTSDSQVTRVPRRTSKRPKRDHEATATPDEVGAGAGERRRSKRPVATATSGHDVVGEATDVKNRWNRFRAGQQKAASAGGGDGGQQDV